MAQRVPLLGILPKIRDDSPDSDEMISAARCVHQIRVTLAAQAGKAGPCVYLITSAAAGEGKTSVTMALALSFAAARVRTLIIDCDWVGRGLTRKLGFEGMDGLHEALAGGSIRPFVRTASGGLSIVPAGRVGISEAFGFSTAALRPLLEEARKDFDVVLIDTGPVLGSVEASVIAQEVDGVILTIARGQGRAAVERSMRWMNSLGVRLAGFVFNQAKLRDFRRSGFSSATMTGSASVSPSSNGAAQPAKVAGVQEFEEFGPLVAAVAGMRG